MLRVSAIAAALSLLAVMPLACGGEPPPPAEAPAPPPRAPAPVASAAPPAPPAPVVDATLPARKVFFGDPDRARVQISPDGKRLGWLAESGGVLNVWVAPADDLAKAQAVTKDTKRGIRTWLWSYDGDHVVYQQDTAGDENWHVYAVDLKTMETKDLTPIEGVNAEIQGASQRRPHELLIGLNDRDKHVHDTYDVDLRTGKRTLVLKDDVGFAGVVPDDDLKVRYAIRQNPDGGNDVVQPDPKDKWKVFVHVPMEDALTVAPVDFDASGKTLYMKDSRGRDTAALFSVDAKTGKQQLIAEDPRADADDVLLHPTKKTVQAVSFDYQKPEWHVVDKSVEADFAYLKTVGEGDMQITSRSLDDKRWLVAFLPSDGPVRYFLYDRGAPGKAGKATFLFSNRKALEGLKLSKMQAAVVKSRDGLDLVTYVTVPRSADADADGVPDHPLPMVLWVHGGPWARDEWGYQPYHQWLASRGYAVMSVNFRGSTGLGKKFLNAANGEWGAKMHDDLIDAVKWAVDHKIADPAKVAIMGGSYGGYATLVGLTFTPDEFACGVDIVGPSNLMTLVKTIPPYWQPLVEVFAKRMGDWRTEDGKKLLAERSPLSHVDAIKKPLLIGQGANDPRVNQAESDQIVSAMKSKSLPVTYVLFPDEGHGFARPANTTSFNAVAEVFLAQCLGGPYQPVGTDFQGSSITVPAGSENVYGLGDALGKK